MLAGVLVVAVVAVRDRGDGWGWGRMTAFGVGLLAAAGALLPPLDDAADRGLLQAHVGQHILLADLAAPLLLLGLPARSRGRIAAWIGRSGRRTRLLGPEAALVLWVAATYAWLIPAAHRAAVPPGALQLLDHVSYLAAGTVIWLAAFDPRPTTTLRAGLRVGGMPWWARHVFAMTSRLAVLPAAALLWLAPAAIYHPITDPWPFSDSVDRDQVAAGAMLLGFEMVLFALALTLGLLFVQIGEGRRRQRGEHPD